MTRSTPSEDDDATTAWQRDEERLRWTYQQLRDDLLHRDREAERDPWVFQRWPRERKVYADRIDRAWQEWESHGHRAAVDDEGRSGGRTDLEHETRDESS